MCVLTWNFIFVYSLVIYLSDTISTFTIYMSLLEITFFCQLNYLYCNYGLLKGNFEAINKISQGSDVCLDKEFSIDPSLPSPNFMQQISQRHN